MADQYVEINSGTGPKIDTSEVTVGSNTVERQRVCLADPTSATGLATVDATNGLSVNVTNSSLTVSDQHTNVTADYDTSAGTQNLTMFGMALPASGGAVAGGTSSNPLRTDPTGTTTQPVSGTVTANAGSGTFAVSGTVTANAGTGTLNVSQQASGSTTVTMQNAASATGNGTVITVTGMSSLTMTVSGTFSATITFEGTQDSSNWASLNVLQLGTNTLATTTTGTGVFQCSVAGLTSVRARISSYTSGNVTVTGETVPVAFVAPTVNANVQGTVPVSGTFWQATQPVSGTVTVQQSTASSLKVDLSGTAANATAIKVDGSGVTQPVSGTFWQSTQPVSIAATVNVADANLEVSQGSTTSGQKGPIVQGAVTTSAPSYTTAQTSPLSLTTAGALRVDNSAVTQPISATSLPLPSGAATSAKQPALGTAGSASSDVITVQGIASMTPLKVDGSGVTQPVSGTVTANAGTGNFATNTAQINGSTVSTAAAGVQKVGIVGNAGATVDATVGAGTAPANAVIAGTVYNSSAPAPTSGQSMALQADQSGNLRTLHGIATATLSAWNSSTSLNATQTIFTNSGATAAIVQLVQTSTLTAGAVTFEVSYDGSNWSTIPANCVFDPTSTSYAAISLPYTVQASTNKSFILSSNGWQALRIKLSTQITGTGTVTPNYALVGFDPVLATLAYSPTAANFNVTAVQSGTWAQNLTQISGGSVATAATGIAKVGLTDGSGNAINSTSNALNVNISSGTIQNTAGTSGGWSVNSQTALTNTKVAVKASAGNFGGYMLYNPNSSAVYIQVWDVASGSVTVGTTAPTYVIALPATAAANVEFTLGITHSTAITLAATTTATGSTAPGTSLTGFFLYK